jgi:hypothetical protein
MIKAHTENGDEMVLDDVGGDCYKVLVVRHKEHETDTFVNDKHFEKGKERIRKDKRCNSSKSHFKLKMGI